MTGSTIVLKLSVPSDLVLALMRTNQRAAFRIRTVQEGQPSVDIGAIDNENRGNYRLARLISDSVGSLDRSWGDDQYLANATQRNSIKV